MTIGEAVQPVPEAIRRAPKIVVGSGWWCDGNPHRWNLGSSRTRSVEFFDLWYRQVRKCLDPDLIVVTDSASPCKPDHRSFERLTWIELDRNYGHPNDLRIGLIDTKFCGFTRTVLSGAMHALCCDADIYVYVEQDCLVQGEDFLAHALAQSDEDILLGAPTENGKGLHGQIAAPMLQQSLMIVRRSGMERFISGILGAPWTDGERSPEETMRLRLAPFGLVGVPYGRSRPIDFERTHFYAQHLDEDELARMQDAIDAPQEMRIRVT
jgi:hypothetical protein